MAETELGGYQVVGRLAVGGMAEVFHARARPTTQRSTGEPDDVVLKRLLPNLRDDAEFVKQFVDEAKLCVRLRHPNIVRTYKLFRTGPDYLMVQELVVGRTLGRLQESLAKTRRALPPAAAVYLVHSVLKALDYVHRARVGEGASSIVHRDVNPANILVSASGEVKLTDFGVADVEGMMRGEAGALRGTIPYMSPEQVLGRAVDARSDLFSAGILLWELFSGRRLHESEDEIGLMHAVRDARIPLLSTVIPTLPDFAVQVVRHALFADRNRRFQSASEFMRALEVLCRREGWNLGAEALTPVLGEGA